MNVILFLLILIINLIKAQRATCADTVGWGDKDGHGCYLYKYEKICINNGFVPSRRFYGGYFYKFPELNCCVCGK